MKPGKNDRSMDIEDDIVGIARARYRARRGRPRRGGIAPRSTWPESSGKRTTLALHGGGGPKKAGICAFIDAEHALDPVCCAQARRQHRRAADLAARQRRAGARDRRHPGALGAVDVLVIDSVAALVPKAELRGRDATRCRASPAQANEPGRCASATASINKSNTMVIFINQIRMKIGGDVRLARDHHRRQLR